jgi:DNA polymerase III subunit gamma/tau
MSYQVLARKYRPQRFSDVIGQDHVTRTLKNALEQNRIAHGYIFSGHRGIGKTTIARILAMALNCQSADHPVAEPCGVCDSCREIRDGSVGSMDVIEIDAATNRGIDEVRNIIATANVEPIRSRFKIFILDEAHQVTDAAFNALLKTLEEPPSWVVFMMATTQPEDIPQTIRSRCQHFSFHAVKFNDIVGQLKSIAGKEGLSVEDDAIALLAEAGDGSMRDALSIMDQAIACCGTTLTADLVRGLAGTVSSDLLEGLMQQIHENSSEEVLRIIDKLIVEGHSPVHFARQLVRYLRNAIMAKVAGPETQLLQVSSDERARVARTADLFTEEDLTRFLQIMLRTHGDVSYKQEQRFHLELGLLKMVHAQRLLPLEQLLSGATAQPSATGNQPRAGSAPPTRNAASGPPRATTPSRPPMGSDRGESPFGRPAGTASRTSPFDADRARKSGLPKDEQSSSLETVSSAPTHSVGDPMPPKSQAKVVEFASPTVSGTSAAVAVALEEAPLPSPIMASQYTPEPEAPAETSPAAEVSIDGIREAVLNLFESNGQRMLAHSLEDGEWCIEGVEVVVKAAISAKLIDISFGLEQKKQANAAISKLANRPMKMKIVSGTPAAQPTRPARAATGPGARSRAANNPLVKKFVEKFGAEIRTVIDHQEE